MRKVKKALCTVLMAGLILPQVMGSALAAGGTWKHNSKGWWYAYSDGTYAKSTWVRINGKWYYFNADGYMATGWIKDQGKWYYLKASGEMAAGWIRDNGKWYFLNSNGAMATGWKKIGGIWYFFSGSGAMATGWRKLGGKWYYFEKSGAMVTGWKDIGDFTYYFFEDGSMATGTVNIDGGDYLFEDNGALVIMGFEFDDTVDGAWDYSPRPVTEEEKTIFAKAMDGVEGVVYEPVQVIATQVVSGTNYLFLCHSKVVYPDAKPVYSLVSIYNDLEGNAQALSVALSDVQAPEEELDGGLYELEDMALTDLYLQEFNKAAEKLTGVDYDPIAVLGIRVVMGIDTFVLCKATPVAQEQDSYYAIVTYYKYDDMYSITAIDPVG